MFDRTLGFVSRSFLRSVWAQEFAAYRALDEDERCLELLRNWSERFARGEVRDAGALVSNIFVSLWGYIDTGSRRDGVTTIDQQHPVAGSGPRGRRGAADAALGWFGAPGTAPVMQVACEFKQLDSDLDAPQRSRADSRSPVEQALNYLTCARRGMVGNEPVRPTWAIVTDMNVFRLYWYDRAPGQYLSFNIAQRSLLQGPGLLGNDEDSAFERFLFKRLFHPDTLLTRGGKSELEQIIGRAWIRSRELERTFYGDYRAYREHLYTSLLASNPNFPGTRGKLVRISQKILDRSIFVFFCEDMGRAIGFPPQLLRDFLIARSRDEYLQPDGNEIWLGLRDLFRAMNDGAAFGGQRLNQFNGGLFRADDELYALQIPNRLFCAPGQGQNEDTLYSDRLTLLYLSASYNYAADLVPSATIGRTAPAEPGSAEAAADARKADPDTALGLYTLGRIFEQSITELEILEAEADGRISVNKESRRKTDGVYYTPEWVVERIVQEALGGRLTDIKVECGWKMDAFGNALANDAIRIDAYLERLRSVRVLDPACGSGAFLITALKHLLAEWSSVLDLRRRVTGDAMVRDEADVIRDVLRDNLYGVDINPASVEITQLALWLHTARGDRPLSSLDAHIRDGNSLVDSRFWGGQIDLDLGDEQRERVNAFDWERAFPDVWRAGGFDVIVGNPPYVKLQKFRRAHPDMADYLRNGREGTDFEGYVSAGSGNFDLYLPFIEKGVELLMPGGRLGYIAPSVWTMSEYGANLRGLVEEQRSLYRWLDFRSHQIFDEATVYTALQFFQKPLRDVPSELEVAASPDGIVSDEPWSSVDARLSYDRLTYGNRWLMLGGQERDLVDQLASSFPNLGHEDITGAVYQGLITSADDVFHLQRRGPGRYVDEETEQTIRIEEALMHPLVSGPQAKRYLNPETHVYILFPYEQSHGRMKLISADRMATRFPNAWAYLGRHEERLRAREDDSFDDDEWYRFGRSQNLDKQNIVKLVVAGTVPGMRVCLDDIGDKYLNNVRVNGILPANGIDEAYLLGVLNGPICDWVFRRIAKPKDNKFFEANRQFIVPLPIPLPNRRTRTAIATAARGLQRLHSEARDITEEMRRRVANAVTQNRPITFVYPTLRSATQRRTNAPRGVDAASWAKRDYDNDLQERYQTIQEALHPDVIVEAHFQRGELKVLADGIVLLDGIFVGAEGTFIAAQWNAGFDGFSPTKANAGRALVSLLRRLIVTDNTALIDQLVQLQGQLAEQKRLVAEAEGTMNEALFALYNLDAAARNLIEAK